MYWNVVVCVIVVFFLLSVYVVVCLKMLGNLVVIMFVIGEFGFTDVVTICYVFLRAREDVSISMLFN